MERQRSGFTLVELLVVVAVLAVLAALLFPVFSSSRSAARDTGCVSNLRQIGLAILAYGQDHDDLFPYAIDCWDRYVADWRHPFLADAPARVRDLARENRTLPVVMRAYVRSPELWCCPADNGLRFSQFGDIFGGQDSGASTAYEAYGMSYGYRTELGLLEKPISSLRTPVEVNVLADAAGYWHTRYHRAPRRDESSDTRDLARWSFNVLFADWHVKNVPAEHYLDTAWGNSLKDRDPFDLHGDPTLQ